MKPPQTRLFILYLSIFGIAVSAYFLWDHISKPSNGNQILPTQNTNKDRDHTKLNHRRIDKDEADALLSDAKYRWDARIKELEKNNVVFPIPTGQYPENFVPDFLSNRQEGRVWHFDLPGNYVDRVLYEAAVALVVTGGSKEMCEALQKIDTLPPSSIHAQAMIAVSRAFEELFKLNAKASLTPWIKLGKSKNAMFRMLAVEATWSVSMNGVHNEEAPSPQDLYTDRSEKFRFYQQMLDDPCESVAVMSVRRIRSSAEYLPEAQDFLIHIINDPRSKVAAEARKPTGQ